jgi:hypothetical protein
MKTNFKILLAEINKTNENLEKLYSYYEEFLNNDFKILGKKRTSACVFSEIFTSYYTCLETLFLRISQFFENELDEKNGTRTF